MPAPATEATTAALSLEGLAPDDMRVSQHVTQPEVQQHLAGWNGFVERLQHDHQAQPEF